MPNKVFGILDCAPEQLVFTANSDTPYGPLLLDLRRRAVRRRAAARAAHRVLDGHQPALGGRHGPARSGRRQGRQAPAACGRTTTARCRGGLLRASGEQQPPDRRRALAAGRRRRRGRQGAAEDDQGLSARSHRRLDGARVARRDRQDAGHDAAGVGDNIKFWEVLHETIETEPRLRGYRTLLRRARGAGHREGQAVPAGRAHEAILERRPRTANAQMRVQSFADRRPDRLVWKDRQWQWAALRFEDGDFNTATHLDLEAREKWFYQAIGASPAMFRRDTRARARSTGWAFATRPAPTSTAARRTGSRCRCRCRASCSGR